MAADTANARTTRRPWLPARQPWVARSRLQAAGGMAHRIPATPTAPGDRQVRPMQAVLRWLLLAIGLLALSGCTTLPGASAPASPEGALDAAADGGASDGGASGAGADAAAAPQIASASGEASAGAPGLDSAALSQLRQSDDRFVANLPRSLRLHRVMVPLLAAAAPACADRTVVHAGFLALAAGSFGDAGRDALARTWALEGDRVQVVALAAGSPAARDGMALGDVIVAVDGVATGEDGDARRRVAAALLAQAPHEIELSRGDLRLRGTVIPMPLCASPVFVADQAGDGLLNDGISILIDGGLVDALERDEDLAAILAHELGQLLLGLRGRPESDLTMPALFNPMLTPRTAWGGLAQPVVDPLTRPFTTAELLAADRAALILLSRAGLDHQGYEALWRRLAAENRTLLQLRPLTRERLAGIGAVRTALADAAARGEDPDPLVPDQDRASP